MNLYADSSAWMRRYLIRPGGFEFDGQVSMADRIATAQITAVEVTCALHRLAQGGAIRRNAAVQATAQLEQDLTYSHQVAIETAVLAFARTLGGRHRLKGYEAVQLAAAAFWGDAVGEPVTFATFDRELWTATRAEGFDAWPPDPSLF